VGQEQKQTAAGCGLAAYALLLLGLCLVGVLGIVASTLNLLSQGPDEVSKLVHGSEVQVWRLQPMRDAGALELTEVPLAWHDESRMRDGSTVCALRSGELVRVEEGQAQQLRFDEIKEVQLQVASERELNVLVSGSQVQITCHFGPGEGGERLAQQLLQESDTAQSD
jgi:hypothetical protein